MGLVLAIDPGRRQGKALERLTQEFQDHEVVTATSGDEALAVLDGVVPDLVLFPLFITSGDESNLQSRLRGLPDPADRQALTLPLRAFFDWEAHATRPAAVPPRWFYWFKPAAGLAPELASPRAFADAVRSDIDRPRGDTGTSLPASATPVASPLLAVPAVAVASLASVTVGPTSAATPSPAPPPPSAAPVLSPAFATALANAAQPLATSSAIADGSRSPAADPAASAADVTSSAPMPAEPVPMESAPIRAQSMFGPTFGSTLATRDEDRSEPEGDELSDAPRPSVFSRIGPAVGSVGHLLGTVWEKLVELPRPVQMGAPVMAILLTLGVTGHVTPLLRMPGRLMGSAQRRFFPVKPKTGIAEIQTVPDGAQVWFEGRQLGVTPLRTEFAAGTHEVELRYKNTARTVMLEVTAGETIVQRIEWTAPKVAGKLRVESDPPGAAVAIDGKPRGNTPLNVDDIAAGKHSVDVVLSGNTVHETVDIKGSKLTTLRTSVYQGWLALFSPIDVKAAVDGRPVALDDQGRVMLPAGSHQLTLQNRALSYNETRTVDIRPGDTTPVNVVLPKTTLSVTTSIPAMVWVDGDKVGEAPITDLPVEIGTRDIVVRSPDQGERHATVTATMNPARVSIDFAASAP